MESHQKNELTDIGFSSERFKITPSDAFNCIICLYTVRKPKMCSQCKAIFCEKCIEKWQEFKKWVLLPYFTDFGIENARKDARSQLDEAKSE